MSSQVVCLKECICLNGSIIIGMSGRAVFQRQDFEQVLNLSGFLDIC